LLALSLILSNVVFAAPKPQLQKATFAGGCFWCIQPPFDRTTGVIRTLVGYTGGTVAHPTYKQVSGGSTGHAESIEIVFDPSRVSYEKLLEIFWNNIDPTTKDAQFPDVGPQYRTAIFYHSPEQRTAAEKSKELIEKSKRFGAPIVTQIVPAGAFWPAEDYHQKYYIKSPDAYQRYHDNSGRDVYFRRTSSR
jgi:methionine-S-sulfoxide reductase